MRLSNRLMPQSIYTLKLHNRGITFPYEERRPEPRPEPPPPPPPAPPPAEDVRPSSV